MGTSSSNKGPKGGVPLVPPWVPDADAPAPPPVATSEQDEITSPASPPAMLPGAAPGPVAPPQRFSGVRRSLSAFAKGGGSGGELQRSLGKYVRSYGGSGGTTRRFGGAAQTAGTLYIALSQNGRGQTSLPGGTLDPVVLSGRSANEVMDAVVEAVRPTDGTQDAEASRVAIKDALSELLTKYPGAALLELTDTQRLFAVERYVALDVFRRFMLDVGKTIQDKAPTATVGLARLKDAKDYIKETVAAAFKKAGTPTGLTQKKVAMLATIALRETFAVFESYVT